MKFKIVGDKVIGNEIFESGFTLVRGADVIVSHDTKFMSYSGGVRVGILKGRSYRGSTDYRRLRFTFYDWTPENRFGLDTIALPDIIGYEKDTNNTLIIMEEVQCQEL